MTTFQALFVKYLRIKCEGSWRWIASKYSQRYELRLPFTDESTFDGNQIVGIELCNQAMDVLNEKVEDGWN